MPQELLKEVKGEKSQKNRLDTGASMDAGGEEEVAEEEEEEEEVLSHLLNSYNSMQFFISGVNLAKVQFRRVQIPFSDISYPILVIQIALKF